MTEIYESPKFSNRATPENKVSEKSGTSYPDSKTFVESHSVFSPLFIDSAPHALVVVDQNGKIINHNQLACDLLGNQGEDLFGRFLNDISPNPFFDSRFVTIERVVQTAIPVRSILEYGGKYYENLYSPVSVVFDGPKFISIISRETNKKPIDDKNLLPICSDPFAIIGEKAQQLKERNRLLEQQLAQKTRELKDLNEAYKLYRTVLETSKDIISTMTLDLKYTYVSSSVVNALGYTPEEMVKINALEIMTPDSAKKIVTSLRDWIIKGASGEIQEENSRTEEAQQIKKDGSVRWAEISGTFLRDEKGKAVGIVTTSRDITERKRLEAELHSSFELLEQRVKDRTAELENMNEILRREIAQRQKTERELLRSESRFEAIFRAATDYIFIKDKKCRYTHINPAMLELTGKNLDQIIGKTFGEVYGQKNAVSIYKNDLKALKGQVVESDYTIFIGDRDVVLNCIRVPIRDETGDVMGICGIARDITERKAQTVERVTFTSQTSSEMYDKTLREIELVAGTDSTVLFLGESGTGKDYLAKYLHEKSRRAGSPFFAVNCAALPPGIADSELFGREAGAYTGSKSRKRGLLELAESGTLLLNEIGELPLNLQAKLLTFMDTQSFTRVGGEKLISVDARILAATNRNLAYEVEAGNFRRDLFFRLNVFTIEVPPLRERIEDLEQLCDSLLCGLAKKLGLGQPPVIDPIATETLA
ncbi:MAG: sigma 54-interacting transcriptional regulator, partial [Syntrophaceae bacterium]|nr:sigma 54-interacting transcriptional regulator [Syntrophaceae bacterium]